MTLSLSIKGRFFLAIGGVLVVSTLCLGIFSYRAQVGQLHTRHEDLPAQQQRLFETILAADAEGLRRATIGLTRLSSLSAPLAAGDRRALLAAAEPLFADLKSKAAITHMYFITPDGTVLLRAHRPEQHGDRLERATYLQAAAARETVTGLEMGKNFFSLRCVAPLFEGGRLLGYLEVAQEIDHVFRQMKTITGTEIALYLPTDYIRRFSTSIASQPESGFSRLYPSTTLLFMPSDIDPDSFLRLGLSGYALRPARHGSGHYLIGVAPIRDAFGNTAGVLFSQLDVSAQHVAIWRDVLSGLGFFILILGGGNLLLYLSMQKSMDFFLAVRRHIQHVTRTWDIDKRIDVATDDEVGELAEDLNLMQAEIGKLRNSLQHQADALAATNQELESFSYTLSHDLRVPLTRAYAAAQLLEEGHGSQLDDDGRALLVNISKGCEGMEELIEAILCLTTVVRRELCVERVDLAELAWDIVEELRTARPEREVTMVIPPELPCQGDRQLLRVVLRDLLENAWKYTGSVAAPRIELGSLQQHGKTAYYVRDNGIGFPAEQAGRLFVPFRRLANAKSHPGTGIGLATVAKIILRHGGSVWASGEEGAGATFFFTLS